MENNLTLSLHLNGCLTVYSIPAKSADTAFDVLAAYEKYHCLPMTTEQQLAYQRALKIVEG